MRTSHALALFCLGALVWATGCPDHNNENNSPKPDMKDTPDMKGASDMMAIQDMPPVADMNVDQPQDADMGEDMSPSAKAALRVVVTTFSGDPLKDVQVEVLGTTLSGVTDARGELLLESLEPAQAPLVVKAQAPGNVPIYGELELTAGLTALVTLTAPAVQRTTIMPSATEDTPVVLGGMTLSVPKDGSFTLPDGAVYTGPLELRAASLNDPALNVAPPAVNADGTTPLVLDTFDISAFSPDGKQLQLGANAKLGFCKSMEISQELRDDLSAQGDKVVLRRYDAASKAWVVTDDDLEERNGQVCGKTDHLSIFAGWAGAFYNVRYTVPASCATGTFLDAAGQPARAKIVHRIQIIAAGGAVFKDEVTYSDPTTGEYCLKLPLSTGGATAFIKTPRNPTGTTHNARVRQIFFVANGQSLPLPMLPDSGPEMCGGGAVCPSINPPPAQLPPTCASRGGDAACNDNNPCTTDRCDANATCPAMTSCSGCSNTITPNVACDDGASSTCNDMCDATGTCVGTAAPAITVASGEPNPPELKLLEAAQTKPFVEPFDGPNVEARLFNLYASQSSMSFANGELTLTDDVLTAGQGGASLDFSANNTFVTPFMGAGYVELELALTTASLRDQVYVRLMIQDNMGYNVGLELRPSGSNPPQGPFTSFVFNVSGQQDNQQSAEFSIAADQKYKLRLSFDGTSSFTGTVVNAAGQPVSSPVSITQTLGAWLFNATLNFNDPADSPQGQPAPVELVKISDFSSDRMVGLPDYWVLTGSQLERQGVVYSTPSLTPSPTWAVAGQEPVNTEDDNGVTFNSLNVNQSITTVYAHLITADFMGQLGKLTIYSPQDAAALDAQLEGVLGPNTIEVIASALAFERQPDGTFRWSLSPICQ